MFEIITMQLREALKYDLVLLIVVFGLMTLIYLAASRFIHTFKLLYNKKEK